MAICQSAHHTLSIFQTSAKVERKNSSSTSSPFFLMNKKNLLAGLPTVAPYSPNPPKIIFDLMWFHEFLASFKKELHPFQSLHALDIQNVSNCCRTKYDPLISQIFPRKFQKIHITSVSGHCTHHLIFKTCQIAAGPIKYDPLI